MGTKINIKKHPKTLFTVDYSRFTDYDNLRIKSGRRPYSYYVKREQQFLKKLLERKYSKTVRDYRLRVLVYIHADFGRRKDKDYKICLKDSPAYCSFMKTDDYSDCFSFVEAVTFFENKELHNNAFGLWRNYKEDNETIRMKSWKKNKA